MSHKYTFQASFCGSHTITPLENQISSLSEVGAKALYSFAVFFPLSPTQTITYLSCFILSAPENIISEPHASTFMPAVRQGKAFHKSEALTIQTEGGPAQHFLIHFSEKAALKKGLSEA